MPLKKTGGYKKRAVDPLIKIPRRLTLEPVDGCGHVVMNDEGGTLTSKNYPETYPDHSVCQITIRVQSGKQLYIKVADLDLDIDSASLKIYKGSSTEEYVSYSGDLSKAKTDIFLDDNTATIRFESGLHVSGRGFLINYASSDHPDFITCLTRCDYKEDPEFSNYCPAGCWDVAGNVFGDVTNGYQESSFICKSAVHAGAIVDNLGGQVLITRLQRTFQFKGMVTSQILPKGVSDSNVQFMFNNPGYISSTRPTWTDTKMGEFTKDQIATDKNKAGFPVFVLVMAVTPIVFLIGGVITMCMLLRKRRDSGDDIETGVCMQLKSFGRKELTESNLSYENEDKKYKRPTPHVSLLDPQYSHHLPMIDPGFLIRKAPTTKYIDKVIKDSCGSGKTESLAHNQSSHSSHDNATCVTSFVPQCEKPCLEDDAKRKPVYTDYRFPSDYPSRHHHLPIDYCQLQCPQYHLLHHLPQRHHPHPHFHDHPSHLYDFYPQIPVRPLSPTHHHDVH
ncbi:discoidin, CUB and LCCL domain-containing protein 1-like [Pelobates fuscus]|uniref:discoidin, CUB and LCCL domain-containing protein 1-like n=1 Tax=Pelobates fuscus TaxID=191477 RepID=UPI002FE4D55D